MYVPGEGGQIIAQLSQVDGSTESPKVEYLHEDHLGSTTTVTSQSAGVGQAIRMAFEPFGSRVDRGKPPTSSSTSDAPGVTLGFAGHEQEDDLGLFNMKGRIYDPTTARFLTADPMVSPPYKSQDFNRYSYAKNSPLQLIDPTGFEPDSSFNPGQDYDPDELTSSQPSFDNEGQNKNILTPEQSKPQPPAKRRISTGIDDQSGQTVSNGSNPSQGLQGGGWTPYGVGADGGVDAGSGRHASKEIVYSTQDDAPNFVDVDKASQRTPYQRTLDRETVSFARTPVTDADGKQFATPLQATQKTTIEWGNSVYKYGETGVDLPTSSYEGTAESIPVRGPVGATAVMLNHTHFSDLPSVSWGDIYLGRNAGINVTAISGNGLVMSYDPSTNTQCRLYYLGYQK